MKSKLSTLDLVIIVIAVVLGFLFINFLWVAHNGSKTANERSQWESRLRAIAEALDNYKQSNDGRLPKALAEVSPSMQSSSTLRGLDQQFKGAGEAVVSTLADCGNHLNYYGDDPRFTNEMAPLVVLWPSSMKHASGGFVIRRNLQLDWLEEGPSILKFTGFAKHWDLITNSLPTRK